MTVTSFTDYSLRALIYLAIQKKELSTIKEIAESYNISRNHLMKVVQELSHRGYVKAIRGKNGGVKLNREPQDINIGTLVRELEQGSALVECFGDNNQCVITPACQLKRLLGEALEGFFVTLETYSLADLIRPKEKDELTKILKITAD